MSVNDLGIIVTAIITALSGLARLIWSIVVNKEKRKPALITSAIMMGIVCCILVGALIIANVTGISSAIDQRIAGQAPSTATATPIVAISTTVSPSGPTIAPTPNDGQSYANYLPGVPISLLYQDPITSGSNWEADENADNTGQCNFYSGAYHATKANNGYRECSWNEVTGTLPKFTYSIDVTLLVNGCAGQMFRETDKPAFAYLFVICTDSNWYLYKVGDSTNFQLVPVTHGPTGTTVIQLNQKYHLDTVAQGTSLTFFLGGQLMGSATQGSSNLQGSIGVAVTDEQPSVTVDATFSNAYLWNLK